MPVIKACILPACFAFTTLIVYGCDKSTSSIENEEIKQNSKQQQIDDSIDIEKITKPVYDKIASFEQALKRKYKKEPVMGEINAGFLKRLVDIIDTDRLDLLISSPGGNPHFALRSARIIDENKHNVTVIGMCSSACADYLLPAATNLEFINLPLIGFHGNPLSNSYFVKKKKGKNTKVCQPDLGHIKRLKKIYNKNNINIDFWKKQYEHLVVESVTVRHVDIPIREDMKLLAKQGVKIVNTFEDCFISTVKTKYKMWYPTSKQLKEDFGLIFTGRVCADYYQCYSKRLTAIGRDGDMYAVGDTLFTVDK